MRRFLLKVNGELHCPGGISRPVQGDWTGGAIELPQKGAVLARKGAAQAAPDIEAGDELWIWTHETKPHGGGVGLAARAIAGKRYETAGRPYVALGDVTILPRKIGRSSYLSLPVSSRVIDYTIGNAHHGAYLLEDGDHEELLALVAERDRPFLEHAAQAADDLWEAALRERSSGEEPQADRQRRMTAARPGQARFRRDVFDRHGARCVLSGCAVEAALEAAHIVSHNGSPRWDDAENGLPLRRDLHGMFDDFLWSIDPDTRRVVLATRLKWRLSPGDPYEKLEEVDLAAPVPRPLLRWHHRLFLLAEEEASAPA